MRRNRGERRSGRVLRQLSAVSLEDEESAARGQDRKNKKSEVILQVFICLRRRRSTHRCFVVVVVAVLIVVDFRSRCIACCTHAAALIRSIRSLLAEQCAGAK